MKDIQQAQSLIDALSIRRPTELADSWNEAWTAGRQWRRKLEAGRARLSNDVQATLDAVVKRK